MRARTKISNLWFFLFATVLMGTCAMLMETSERARAANGESLSAIYSHGDLRVNIPFKATHSGTGQLTVEVLNPEDDILGHSEHVVTARDGSGVWQESVRLAKAPAVDELVWHRLRYRFVFSDQREPAVQGTESISRILRTPVIRVLGQQAYLSGGPAAIRVVVTDSRNESISGTGTVRIDLSIPNQKPRVLYSGALNRRGTAEADFHFPVGMVGAYSLHYVVDTAIGSTELTQPVRLEDKVSILLTTEKPIYQPGQTIHVRALALDRSNHQAAAGRKLTFELEDSRGNKVFKKVTQTGKFGIAAAEFGLADEVNLGTYHLRAVIGDAEAGAQNNAQIALNVERYVLPKFKVAIEFTGKAKHGYRPGDRVTGIVRASYFFGKPVEGGEITVKATGMDVAQFEAGSVQGKTDHEGAYHFDLKLPGYFAGRPLNQGAARVLVEATVKDSAAHAETRGQPVTVSESPLIVTAVPEGGTLIPNLENQVFLLTSYADGQPARASVKVRTAGNAEQNVNTDAGGVAVVRVKAGAGTASLAIEASDAEGNRTSVSVPLNTRGGDDQILLRTEHAVYRAGDRIALKIFSTKSQGSAYVDVVREGQTVLTRDLDIVNGAAELVLTATPEMAGTLDFNAYLFGRDARPVSDHRLVFVQPAGELKIAAAADATVYKPGGDARIRFHVTNARGEGVQAALGLQVVDEAVFALAEKQPGFAKVFFYLEQEAMKPRVEIHSIGMTDVVEPVEAGQAEQRDRAARALFAATEMVSGNKFETEAGRITTQAKWGEYYGRYHMRFQSQVARLAQSLSRTYSGGDLTAVMAKLNGPEARDSWNNVLRLEHAPWDVQKKYYIVTSAGPDQRFNTGDEMAAYVEVRTGRTASQPGAGAMDVAIEHDRGPANGRSEIVGFVFDATRAAIAGATITARQVSTGSTRRAKASENGQFNLAGLPPGEYELRVESAGFRSGSTRVTLEPRDRANVAATLDVSAVTESVVLADTGRRDGARMERRGGVAGGVPAGMGGGVIGGILGGFPAAAPAEPQPMLRMMNMIVTGSPALKKDASEAPAARVRSYFPEALYINPEIITDQHGNASIAIPLADSITTWRMAMVASTVHGALGSGVSSIKVFQDFFVDLDLPITLTQGDRVAIPVAVYNYSPSRGDVSLKLQPDNWYSLVQDVPDKTLAVETGRVGGSQFTLEAKRIGKFKLTLSAAMGTSRADIIVREIEVIPNGREQNTVFNGRLESSVDHNFDLPEAAIPDASKLFVRLYPGPLSQVIEGMDSILRMPGGCFEQTSSSTYPNVLALDYMKTTKKSTPEVRVKAEGYIANGYQRLLTFEVPGGGFSWFGSAPANKILTAYGLMEFHDMSKVYEVDRNVILRTQQWLAGQQQADGSWKPDTSFINEGATNRYNSDVLRITAYIAWSLRTTGYQGTAVEKARQFIGTHMDKKLDNYTLAVLANFAVDYAKDRAFTGQAMKLLLDARSAKDEQVWWTAEETAVYATGTSASVETTGLAVQALLKWGEASAVAGKALTYIAAKKDASGTWGTTQATIMALRALLLASGKGAADVRGDLEISLNGRPVERLTLTAENNDLLHQFVLKGIDAKSANRVSIRFHGKGGLAYQVVGRYFLPWNEKPANEPLDIQVTYDRTQLAQDDVATATAVVRNNMRKIANMVMVDLGIPPGFDLLSEDLQAFVEKTAGRKGGRLEKFSMTATQAILYFDSVGGGETIKLRYRLRAKYPVRAKTFQSRVYEYYDPEVSSVARPVQLEVRKR